VAIFAANLAAVLYVADEDCGLPLGS